MTFTGREHDSDLLDCEHCHHQAEVPKNSGYIPEMKCPKCGKRSGEE